MTLPNPWILGLGGFVLAALLQAQRERWRVAAIAGVVALAALWPALPWHDGVLSPSRSIAQVAPWAGSGVAYPDLGMVDVTWQVEPWLLHLRRELRAGRLPWWNPHQSSGAPFWSNGSAAPLFPLHLLFVALPLQLGLLMLPLVRVIVAFLGARQLARELGMSENAALLGGVGYALCGRLSAFLLYPMANALMLVPWLVLAALALARGSRRAGLGLAALGALQLLAGHPETAVFTGMITAAVVVQVAPRRSGLLVGGWVVALLLAAPALLPLAVTLFETARWTSWQPGSPLDWSQTFGVLLRFVMPEALGHPREGTGFSSLPHLPTQLSVGSMAVGLAVAGLIQGWRQRRLRALAITGALCLVASLQLLGSRQLLLALPVVGKAVHHYLLCGTELALAILAARGLDGWIRGDRRGLRGGAVVTGVAVLAAAVVLWDDWSSRGLVVAQVPVLLGVLVVTLMSFDLLGSVARRHWVSLALVFLAAIDLGWASARINPGAPLLSLWPRTGAIDFLAARAASDEAGRVVATGANLRPNAAMVYGLFDARGDDSLKLAAYEDAMMQPLGANHPTFFVGISRFDEPTLDRLGVRWILDSPGSLAPAPQLRLAYEGADSVVWERPGAPAVVRLERGGQVQILERSPGRWHLRAELGRDDRLVVAEVAAAGWSARVDGRAVELTGEVFLELDLPPGAHQIDLRYRPAGLGWGLMLAGLGAVVAAAWWRLSQEQDTRPALAR